jgi:RNA polymerase sigma factor
MIEWGDQMSESSRVTGEIDQAVLSSMDSPEKVEALITKNEGYIRSKALRYGVGLPPFQRDELHSIALMAFYEALNTYRADKGHFYPFADIVIRRRIIDELRRTSKNADTQIVTLDEEAEEYGQSRPIQDASMEDYKRSLSQNLLAEEIEQYTAELKAWGIDFDGLVAHSPHHAAVRAAYNEIISKIMENQALLAIIREKRYFPIKKVQEITGIPRKKLERSRIYVISVIIVLTGDYDLLAGFMPEVAGDGIRS